MNLFNLFAKLTLDKSNYDKNIKEAGQSGKNFGGLIQAASKVAVKGLQATYAAVTAATAAIVKFTIDTINNGDAIDKGSQRLNMSRENYQKWDLALQLAGSSISSLQAPMRYLTELVTSAGDGSAEALIKFDKLGLKWEDLQNLTPEEQLKAVVEAFQEMAPSAEKTTLATEIFGRGAQDLLPILNEQKGSLDANFKSFAELGLIMKDDAIDASVKVQDEWTLLAVKGKSMARELVSAVIPMLSDVINGFMKLAQGTDGASKEIAAAIFKIVDVAAEKLPEIVSQLIDIVLSLIKEMTNPEVTQKLLKTGMKMIVALINGIIEALPTLIPYIMELPYMIIDELLKVNWIEMFGNMLAGLYSGIFKGLSNLSERLFGENINGFLNKMIDGINWLIAQANKISIKLPGWLGGKTFGINIKPIPRLYTGIDFVPNDRYLAHLDYGERVLTQVENKEYSSLGGIKGMQTLINGIGGVMQNKQLTNDKGTIVIPIYIGNEKLDTLVVNAWERGTQRQGKRFK